MFAPFMVTSSAEAFDAVSIAGYSPQLLPSSRQAALLQDAGKKLAQHIDASTAPAAVSAALQGKLPAAQEQGLLSNHVLVSLMALQQASGKKSSAAASAGACLATAQALADASPDSEQAHIVACLATAQAKSTSDALQKLESWADAHAEFGVSRSMLVAAHIAASAQPPQLERALQWLRSERLPPQARFEPRLIATRAALSQQLDSAGGAAGGERAVQELQSALAFWRGQPASAERAQACVACLQQLAAVQLQQGDLPAAREALAQAQVRSWMRFQ